MMHDREKSDSVIVAEKPTNKAASAAAEPVEPRTGTERITGGQHAPDTEPGTRVTGARP
jgi:RNA-directed DNA polymerase